MAREARTGRWLAAAFATAIVGFHAATIGGLVALHGVHRDATSIVTNAAPSTHLLTQMRGQVRRLEDLAASYALSPSPETERRIERERRELRANIEAYARQPAYPGEREVWPYVEEALRHFDAALAQSMEAARAGRAEEAGWLVTELVAGEADRLAEVLLGLVELNMQAAQRLAGRIDRARARHILTVLVLNLLATAPTSTCASRSATPDRACGRASRRACSSRGRARRRRRPAWGSGSRPSGGSSRATAAASEFARAPGAGACSGSSFR